MACGSTRRRTATTDTSSSSTCLRRTKTWCAFSRWPPRAWFRRSESDPRGTARRSRSFGERDDVLDALCAEGEHDQAVDAEGVAAGLWHALAQGGKEALVDGVGAATLGFAASAFGAEAARLLDRIGELTVAVRELDAARVELES